MKDTKRKVTIIGSAMTRPASYDPRDYRQYAAEPVFRALEEIGLKPRDVQVFSVAYNERTIPDAAISPLMADALGGLNAPVIPVSSACAGGGVAAFTMHNFIASGQYEIGVCLSFSRPTSTTRWIQPVLREISLISITPLASPISTTVICGRSSSRKSMGQPICM